MRYQYTVVIRLKHGVYIAIDVAIDNMTAGDEENRASGAPCNCEINDAVLEGQIEDVNLSDRLINEVSRV